MNNSDLPNNNIIMQNSDWIERFPFLEFNGTMSEDEVLNLVQCFFDNHILFSSIFL